MGELLPEKIERRALIFDGAMETPLHAKGISRTRSFDELNLTVLRLVDDEFEPRARDHGYLATGS